MVVVMVVVVVVHRDHGNIVAPWLPNLPKFRGSCLSLNTPGVSAPVEISRGSQAAERTRLGSRIKSAAVAGSTARPLTRKGSSMVNWPGGGGGVLGTITREARGGGWQRLVAAVGGGGWWLVAGERRAASGERRAASGCPVSKCY